MTEKKENNRDARMLYLSYGFSHPLIIPQIRDGFRGGQAVAKPPLPLICMLYVYVLSIYFQVSILIHTL
jgi:hypothetical protein